VLEGRVVLLLSPALIDELRDLLNRPALQAKSSRLTPDRRAFAFDVRRTLGIARFPAGG